jgi:ABC-2 type transport system ATP-binding protein
MNLAIETHQLSKRYRRVSALTECTVTVPEGRFSALVGPNGAGKSTTMRLILGPDRPSAGLVTVAGRPYRGMHRRRPYRGMHRPLYEVEAMLTPGLCTRTAAARGHLLALGPRR